MTKRSKYYRFLMRNSPCGSARMWIDNNPKMTPRQLWESCESWGWMVWITAAAFGWRSEEHHAVHLACLRARTRKGACNAARKTIDFRYLMARIDLEIAEKEVTRNG